MKRFIRMTLIAVCTATAGCATGNMKPDSARDQIHQALQESAKSAAPRAGKPPEDVSNALLPDVGVTLPAGSAGGREERFDINVRNVDARSFFMGLVKNTPYNMVVHPQVSGRISLTLKNVTVPEVMDTVRDVYGYDFQKTASGYLVLPAKIQTRIFQVNYLNFTRKGKSKTRVTSGQSTENPAAQNPYGGGLYGGAYGGGGAAGGGNNREDYQAGTEIDTEMKSEFWDDLKTTLDAIVGNKDGRKVVVNADSGVVVVRAMPDELRDVRNYLDRVQGAATREVVLEAKIVEVTLNNGFQSGINWSALGRPGSGKTVLGGNVGGQGLFDNGASDLSGTSLNLQPGTSPLDSLPSSAFGGTFALALNLNDFNAFIELLDTQGDTHVLSSPRVATVNNQKAVIKVGSDEFFVTGVTSNTVTGTATSTNQNIILTPFFSGIALDVTPQIDDDGQVILHIHPTVSDVRDQRKEVTVGGQTQSLPLAFSEVRESDSVVRARSGQIVVIGGLMKTSTKDEVAQTPFLSDIPLLGQLFTQKRQRQVKTELVILLKPVVVNSPSDWSNLAHDHLDDFRNMEGLGKGDSAH